MLSVGNQTKNKVGVRGYLLTTKVEQLKIRFYETGYKTAPY